MFTSSLHNNRYSPIYSKAQEILRLAHHLSEYLSQDLSEKDIRNYEDPHIYISGDIVQQSFSLGPHILKAEEQYFQEDKHRHAISILNLCNRLYYNCQRLENANSNGKEYVPVILKEIRRFRHLLRKWLITL